MAGILELSFLIIILGAKGFTRTGLPFSSKTNLTGRRGQAVGAACLALGLAGVVFVYVVSDAMTRERMLLVGRGILVGLIGAFLLADWSAAGNRSEA